MISIKESNGYDVYAQLKDVNERCFTENEMILCKDDNGESQEKGERDASSENKREYSLGISADAATDGSGRVKGHYSSTQKNSNGSSSKVEVSGGLSKDGEGKSKGEVRFEFERRW